jgi:tRNA pseudouridine38-40 synthase
MRTIKLTLAYDGTDYAGWQVQQGRRTVQGVLEETLRKITRETVRVTGSSRTDAGVHALGQVAAFRTNSHLEPAVFRRALNALLPRDVAVLEAAEVAEGFDPIGQAVRKRYRYVIHDGPVRNVFHRHYCWKHPQPLDAEAMDRAATALRGKHDFASFENRGSQRLSTIRTILDIRVQRGWGDQRDQVTIEVEADGFLYNMVRNIVGTLVEVGRGAKPVEWVAEVLRSADRRLAGPTAPPQGLFLMWIEYGLA